MNPGGRVLFGEGFWHRTPTEAELAGMWPGSTAEELGSLADMVDLAGVAPIMIYVAEQDRVVTISGLGRWPRAASVEYFRKHHGGRIPLGVERCITPAAPDAWIMALREFGTMSLADVMQDAITLAEQGFPMHHFMAANLKEGAEQMSRWKSSAAIFLPGGRPPAPGEVFVQKDLGRTMRRMVAAEAAARSRGREAGLEAARDLFYRGEIAQAIVSAIREAGMMPVNLGAIPTPAVMCYAIARGKGSIMVTGSHIPFDRNGYKTNSSCG